MDVSHYSSCSVIQIQGPTPDGSLVVPAKFLKIKAEFWPSFSSFHEQEDQRNVSKVCGDGQKAKMYRDNNNADSLNVYYGGNIFIYLIVGVVFSIGMRE